MHFCKAYRAPAPASRQSSGNHAHTCRETAPGPSGTSCGNPGKEVSRPDRLTSWRLRERADTGAAHRGLACPGNDGIRTGQIAHRRSTGDAAPQRDMPGLAWLLVASETRSFLPVPRVETHLVDKLHLSQTEVCRKFALAHLVESRRLNPHFVAPGQWVVIHVNITAEPL